NAANEPAGGHRFEENWSPPPATSAEVRASKIRNSRSQIRNPPRVLLANPPHPPPAALARQQVRVPGAVGGQAWEFDRGEPQPRQSLQLRLHLLPGRSTERSGD